MKSDLSGTRLLRPWGDCSDCGYILCAGKKMLPCVRHFLSFLLSICFFIQMSGAATAGSGISPEKIRKVGIIKDTWVSAVNNEQYGNNGAENRLKIKGQQEFALIDFIISPIASYTAGRAEAGHGWKYGPAERIDRLPIPLGQLLFIPGGFLPERRYVHGTLRKIMGVEKRWDFMLPTRKTARRIPFPAT